MKSHWNMITSSNGNIFRVTCICAVISTVAGEFPSQRPVTRSYGVFFDLRLNKRLSKQTWGWWFETQSLPLWRHCNDLGWPRITHAITTTKFITYNRSPSPSSYRISHHMSSKVWEEITYPVTNFNGGTGINQLKVISSRKLLSMSSSSSVKQSSHAWNSLAKAAQNDPLRIIFSSFHKRGSDGGVFCARFESDWTSAIDITAFHNISVGGESREDVPYSNSDIAFRDEVNFALQRVQVDDRERRLTSVVENAVGVPYLGIPSRNHKYHKWVTRLRVRVIVIWKARVKYLVSK